VTSLALVVVYIRQGGVLYPLLFAVYADNLIAKLRCSACGIYIYIASLFYGCILLLTTLFSHRVPVMVPRRH